MPVPDFESVMLPLLTLFADGQPHHMANVIESVADHFNLTPAERNETLATGTRRIASNVGWARTDLGKAGLLERVTRGTWKITDAGQVLGRSGDAGIDGVINEDRLGLDSIYVQAKRWEGVVGRPIVQSFVGSMLGRQAASKGILLTTSTFSQEARQYARGLNMRVILIDGPTLARLMIEHGVGITVVRTVQIKRIDSDYFDEA